MSDDQAERIYDEAARMVREDPDAFTHGARAEAVRALRQAREDMNAPSRFFAATNADDPPEKIAEQWTAVAPVVTKASIWLPVSEATWDDFRSARTYMAWEMLKLEDYVNGYRSPFAAPFLYRVAPWWAVPIAWLVIARDTLKEVGW